MLGSPRLVEIWSNRISHLSLIYDRFILKELWELKFEKNLGIEPKAYSYWPRVKSAELSRVHSLSLSNLKMTNNVGNFPEIHD